MKSALICNFRRVEEIPAGSIVVNGKTIHYDKFYRIVFDQIINNKVKECNLKISQEIALNINNIYKLYDNIVINLDIDIYSNRKVAIKVISIEKK